MKPSVVLPFPLKRVLDVRVDDEAIQRIRRALDAPRSSKKRSLELSAIAVPLAVVFCVVALGLLAIDQLTRPAAELHHLDGRVLADLEVLTSAPRAELIALDDGSNIELDPGSRVETLENRGTVVTLLLKRGRGKFAVAPGGPRRWVVECGLASVEVVGTRFLVDRKERSLRVSVEEGVVLVRGARVPDGIRQLKKGEVIELEGEPDQHAGAKVTTESPTWPDVQVAPIQPQPQPQIAVKREPRAPEVAVDHKRKLAVEVKAEVERAVDEGSRGRHPGDVEETPAIPIAPHTDSPRPTSSTNPPNPTKPRLEAAPSRDEMLARADEARKRGDAHEAAAILESVIANGPSDTQSALAAFTLGRIELFELLRFARARRAFERALSLPLPEDLQQDALAYLADAQEAGGDTGEAARTAERYIRKYPRGRHAERLSLMLELRP